MSRLILDNFSTHVSNRVKKEDEQLGMYLAYLPPYSLDLNPIEFIWKSIKRRFSRHAESLSFAESWIEKFIPLWI